MKELLSFDRDASPHDVEHPEDSDPKLTGSECHQLAAFAGREAHLPK